MPKTSLSPKELKEKGNKAFHDGDWNEALSCYTSALDLAEEDNAEKAVYYKNRAAVHLKQNRYAKAVQDCNQALKICQSDPKALYKRCQALEALELFEEAYRDARNIANVDPSNKAIRPILARLHKKVQEQIVHSHNSSTRVKVAALFKLAFDIKMDNDRRETAMFDLLYLAREDEGAEVMYGEGVTQKLIELFEHEKNDDLVIPAIGIMYEICESRTDKTLQIVQDMGVSWFLKIVNSKNADRIKAAEYCIQAVLNSLCGMGRLGTKPDSRMCETYKKEIDAVLSSLVYSVTDRTISGLARDALIKLITGNMHYADLNWAERLVEIGGLQRLMEVASELEEYKYESSMNITPSTRKMTSVCLARIYENMYSDAAKEKYMNAIDEFIEQKLLSPDADAKIRVVAAMTPLLYGPRDVGMAIMARENIAEMMHVMRSTGDGMQLKVVSQCDLASAASTKKEAIAMMAHEVHTLKKQYQSKDDSMRVRAFVGLCSFESYGGSDITLKLFADGATKKLAEACRTFLVNPKTTNDMRAWAVNGLSYLTFDAEVKEKLIDDKHAVQAMIEFAKAGEAFKAFVRILVNLCNAYDEQETIPEMVENAEFAKHHIPEEHEFDEPDFVNKRLCALANAGVTTALVRLSETDSENSKELIARVFNAICSQKEVRGIVVQQGGAEALLPLALNGTSKGKTQASQALARLGMTINLERAFPGQRIVEVIRVFLDLLKPEFSSLGNFEALMALCNLASVSDSVRKNILKEGGFTMVETFMYYEDDAMLVRAATEVIANLMMHEDTIPFFESEYDRVNFLVIICEDEDEPTRLAASGALATLTSVSVKACKKVLGANNWLESIHFLLANPNPEVQHRGVTIVHNMIKSTKEAAEKIIETDVMDILMALTKSDLVQDSRIKEIAAKALEAAVEWDVIQKTPEENSGEVPALTDSTARTASAASAAPAATTASTAPSPRT